MTTARLRTRSHYPYGGAPGKDITTIRGFGSPGETVSLAFALEADGDVGELVVEAAELHGPGGPVALDVHVVGVWEQAGVGVRRGTPMRVPELLLKDDRVALEGRYVRGCGTPWHPHRTRV
ncbi:MAG: hypothetical protein JWM73_733, partial [Solirubrobacterales bacterium]|nr:hypothetical protein [Solirubrobacterales bacterium]